MDSLVRQRSNGLQRCCHAVALTMRMIACEPGRCKIWRLTMLWAQKATGSIYMRVMSVCCVMVLLLMIDWDDGGCGSRDNRHDDDDA